MSDKSENLMIIGVGGGGCHFVSSSVTKFGPGVQAAGFDSDALTIRSVTGMRCQIIGAARYDGRSTGGDIVKGKTAVQDDEEIIREAIKGVRLAIVVTALGGGFGSGATPEILRIAHDLGITTLCVAILPFKFEGPDKADRAKRVLPLLEESADAIVTLPLDDIYASEENQPINVAMANAESALSDALMLFWSLILCPGYIALNSERLLSLVQQSGGPCRFAVATADGEERARECVARLGRSTFLGANPALETVQAVALGVMAGSDLRLTEISTISTTLRSLLHPSCSFNLGTVIDDRFNGSIKLVAIFFDVMRPEELSVDSVPSDGSQLNELRPQRSKKKVSKSKLANPTALFSGIEATFLDGENLDIPTYQRLGITLDR